MAQARNLVLDCLVLDRLETSIGPQDLAEYMAQVLESAGAARAEFRQRAAEGDFSRLAQIAHAIKSGCAYLGATGLVERLSRLEAQALDGGPSIADVTAVLAELDSFLDEVRSEREARGNGGSDIAPQGSRP